MPRRRRTTDEDGALTNLMVQTLLVLAGGDSHGYAILQEIERRTDAELEIGAATLYRTLKRLVDAGLIEETDDTPASHSQRRCYRITQRGGERVAAEARRLDTIVRWARSTDLIGADS